MVTRQQGITEGRMTMTEADSFPGEGWWQASDGKMGRSIMEITTPAASYPWKMNREEFGQLPTQPTCSDRPNPLSPR